MIVMPEKMSRLEFDEIHSRIEALGWGPLLRMLMEKDSIAYTKNGRLNKSSICRKLNLTNKELDSALADIRREFS